ncbi:MAG: WcaF family extracellular polysaccharide biosynthesis acetyltransferase [Chitinophagaceae bacterium]
MTTVSLKNYQNKWYNPGAGKLKQLLWLLVSAVFMQSGLFPFNALKIGLLRLFGATIGKGVVIKPSVHIKYPWYLTVGDDVWIGEKVWIDNLVLVSLGDNVCVSQGAYLLTGNHSYKSPNFDLIVGGITIENGAWIGAKATVCPGITVGSHAVITVGSVLTTNALAYSIYRGNPAIKIKERNIHA